MDNVLNESEVRILACLIEKEMTTPEYYPLSLNSLTNACNQKSNRNPVVSYEETDVAQGLESLQGKGLVRKTLTPGSRVPKYRHAILDRFDLSNQEMAILSELMLRGPQTVGELRGRTERIYSFTDLAEVDATLADLADSGYVTRLPRMAGRKESRYAHLLAGPVELEQQTPAPEPAVLAVRAENERITLLEEELQKLRQDFDALQAEFMAFKKEFE